jgi:hypothetical protein
MSSPETTPFFAASLSSLPKNHSFQDLKIQGWPISSVFPTFSLLFQIKFELLRRCKKLCNTLKIFHFDLMTIGIRGIGEPTVRHISD